jgi:hypothetical protein
MPRKGLYRVNSVALILSFVATHILSVGLVLVRYCQNRGHTSCHKQHGRSIIFVPRLLCVLVSRLQTACQLSMSTRESSACNQYAERPDKLWLSALQPLAGCQLSICGLECF